MDFVTFSIYYNTSGKNKGLWKGLCLNDDKACARSQVFKIWGEGTNSSIPNKFCNTIFEVSQQRKFGL